MDVSQIGRPGIGRRDFLRMGTAGVLATAVGSCSLRSAQQGLAGVASARARPGGPNVLFIAIDDLNDWVGCLGGHPDAITPNIDRLAARGTLFTRAYASATLCNPSRASVMTGLSPLTSGIHDNHQLWCEGASVAQTLTGHFMRHGYEVMGAGKIFHGHVFRGRGLARRLPWTLSRHMAGDRWGPWDDYVPLQPDPLPPGAPLSGLSGMGRRFDWGPSAVPEEETGDYRVSRWVARKLEERRERPFFLAAGFFRPHLPWYAPARYQALYEGRPVALAEIDERDLLDLPAASRARAAQHREDFQRLRENGLLEEATRAYLASVSFTDANVGRVLDALEANGRADDTIVVLWSDHGFHLGEKLTLMKNTLWERAARVPLVVAGPDVPAAQCDRTVSLLDLHPTLSDLCGLPVAPHTEGRSLRPLLRAPRREWNTPAITWAGPEAFSVRTERWRYIHNADGSEELYDHRSDPNEWWNLAREPSLADLRTELAFLAPRDA